VHHLVPWESGGRTDIDNLVLVCGRHHTAHHAGQYPIRMRNGIPWVQLPGWQNIAQPWVRNITRTYHHLANATAPTLGRHPTLPGVTDGPAVDEWD
jgi:hypothetical protein